MKLEHIYVSVQLNHRPTWEGQLEPIGRCEYPQLHPSHHQISLTVCGFIVRAQATVTRRHPKTWRFLDSVISEKDVPTCVPYYRSLKFNMYKSNYTLINACMNCL